MIYFTITSYAKNYGGIIVPTGAVAVEKGTSLTYYIYPNDGKCIKNVNVDAINLGAISSYTFTDVTANHKIYVTFGTLNKRGVCR